MVKSITFVFAVDQRDGTAFEARWCRRKFAVQVADPQSTKAIKGEVDVRTAQRNIWIQRLIRVIGAWKSDPFPSPGLATVK